MWQICGSKYNCLLHFFLWSLFQGTVNGNERATLMVTGSPLSLSLLGVRKQGLTVLVNQVRQMEGNCELRGRVLETAFK
jgi:hypothetical protein